jgi:tetratricopeptide (TPR) repeat protein
LEFSAQNGNEVQYQSEYINCLIALHDIRSLMVIDNHLKRFEAYAKEKDFVMENDSFYLFLIRRKAYCFVELKQYDQAKIYLNKVLEIDPNNQYAKNELTYIRQVVEAMNK